METTKAMKLDWEKKMRENDTKALSNSYFSYSPEQNEKEAIELFRYVFGEVLHWTPDDIRNRLTMDIIDKLKLKKPYGKFLFPRELSARGDYWYIAKKCYPDRIHGASIEDIWKMEYLKVLDNRCGKFPKNYFTESEGQLRAKVFLLHQLNGTVRFESAEELYMFFADSATATKYLDSLKLKTPLEVLFHSPLEYLHEALPEVQRDEFLFKFAEFTEMDKKFKKQEQKEKRNRAKDVS